LELKVFSRWRKGPGGRRGDIKRPKKTKRLRLGGPSGPLGGRGGNRGTLLSQEERRKEVPVIRKRKQQKEGGRLEKRWVNSGGDHIELTTLIGRRASYEEMKTI